MQNRCYASKYRRCPYASFCHLQGKKELTCPVITMSHGRDRSDQRLSGEVFGSCLTFGAAGSVSAPGQINALTLRSVLELLHENS